MTNNKKKHHPTSFRAQGIVCHLDGNTLHVSGKLSFDEAAGFVRWTLKTVRPLRPERLILELSGLEYIDSAGVMALAYLQNKLGKKKIKTELTGGSESINEKTKLFSPGQRAERPRSYRPGAFEYAGYRLHLFFSSYLMGFLILAANISYWGLVDLFNKRSRRKGEFVNQAVLIGANAALIVVFLSFVIGYVIALHSAGQLRVFGANIFVVDLVVISYMSQMGPLITAILVAGRSGSSIAAEIATMQVTSELDALKTMGLNPNRFVVVPKLYACMLTMPFLIVLANVSGITGGAMAAWVYLDISPGIFINRMEHVLQAKDLYTGLVKSQVFAGLIVLTGSFYGFRVEKGAEGVGKVTTTAVVVAITLVILADSILGVIFY